MRSLSARALANIVRGTAATIFGDTPKPERDRIIAAFKRGEIRALASMGVLTTGFNAPRAGGLIETAYQLEIRNAKSEKVVVTVVEPIAGEWQMLQESHPHKKESAHSAVWEIPVPAEGKATLTWRVRVKY